MVSGPKEDPQIVTGPSEAPAGLEAESLSLRDSQLREQAAREHGVESAFNGLLSSSTGTEVGASPAIAPASVVTRQPGIDLQPAAEHLTLLFDKVMRMFEPGATAAEQAALARELRDEVAQLTPGERLERLELMERG